MNGGRHDDIVEFPYGDPPEPADGTDTRYGAILDIRDHVDALAAVLRLAEGDPKATAADIVAAIGQSFRAWVRL